MVGFQEIAIGLLQLSHPETFVSIGKQNATAAEMPASLPSVSASEPALAPVVEPNHSVARRSVGRAASLMRAFKFAFAALAAGSRVVPLGDNSQLVRDLAAHAASIYGNS
ncbi:MAG TPA: hypothetical protein VNR70_03235 [Steroidobacteraceae bacterium]|nr:hypothetical protein [Steroidobacteraceae bacterium]